MLFKYVVINTTTLQTISNTNITINQNASATTFCNALNQFSFYNQYSISCTLDWYDQDYMPTTLASKVYQAVWNVTINLFRPASVASIMFTSGSAAFLLEPVTLQAHSP